MKIDVFKQLSCFSETPFKPKILCIMGPTASGKSQLSMEIAQQILCEIISVDSAMVYRGMDIGTAKPTKEDQEKVPHHLIDIRDPSEPYSAADFRRDALRLIDDIIQRKKQPLLVGGTMLYFKALQQGLSDMPSSNEAIRQRINEEAKEIGWEGLHQKLFHIDQTAAEKIHPNDAQRIQRALEVYEITKKPISSFRLENSESPYQYINIAPGAIDRKILHERIAERFCNMLELGFIEEVKRLYDRGDLHADLPAIRSVGYRQAWQYLEGQISFDEMKEKAIAATRQLAKRQLTWLRSWQNLQWCDNPKKSLFL